MVQQWNDESSLTYQACLRREAESAHAISLSMDGKRLGQPAEETEVYVAYLFPNQVAAFPLPQAPGITLFFYSCVYCWPARPTPYFFPFPPRSASLEMFGQPWEMLVHTGPSRPVFASWGMPQPELINTHPPSEIV